MLNLEQDLYKTTGSIETLLGQAMYFGLSFSRVGFDFRPMLIPVFERVIMRQMNKQLNIEMNLKVVAESFSALNLNKIAGLKHPSTPANQDDVSQPPLLLLDYPPLALACNHILATLNTLRLCAPVSCVQQVTTIFKEYLSKLSQQILGYHTNNHAAWSTSQEEGFKKLCLIYKSILLPYLQNCLSAVFSPKHLSEISGLSITDLRARNLSFLDLELICEDLQQFITSTDESVKENTEANGDENIEPRTDYVADRLAELTIAVHSPEKDGLNGEASVEEIQNQNSDENTNENCSPENVTNENINTINDDPVVVDSVDTHQENEGTYTVEENQGKDNVVNDNIGVGNTNVTQEEATADDDAIAKVENLVEK